MPYRGLVPRPGVGEIPKAFVVLKPDCSASAQELMDFCGRRIAAYKRIREVEFIDEVPKSAVGKALRRILRERQQSPH